MLKNIILKPAVFISFLLSFQLLSAQTRIAVYSTDLSELQTGFSTDINEMNRQNLSNVADRIVSFYTNDDRFLVIDRANYNLIEDEQERQKSEEFIDGYVVEQGKQEGADYIFYTKYLRKEKSLYLRVYDVREGKVFCESEQKFDVFLGVIKDAGKKVAQLLNKVNNECFSVSFPVVRSLDKKAGSKTKILLVAIGRNQKVKENYELEVFHTVTEKVGDKEIKREEVIGKGKIDKVEDANFSQLKITKGGEAIALALKNGEALFCKLISG
ncbi:MAG TPA: hypothetical protein ENJ95_14170 [Bacteroidetes bacterium]|nr:hypothetical protein [Bacteroidota bacterium]